MYTLIFLKHTFLCVFFFILVPPKSYTLTYVQERLFLVATHISVSIIIYFPNGFNFKRYVKEWINFVIWGVSGVQFY